MEQIDIYHEAPLCIFDKVKQVTEGDYALVHLLDKDEKYATKFVEAANTRGDRKIILDNSAYELGEAFDEDTFAHWINMLQPDIYVVPDKPGDAERTVDSFHRWNVRRSQLRGKKMGVLQGSSVREIIDCFKLLKFAGADIIGIPFLIGQGIPYSDSRMNGTALSLMYARVQLISILADSCEPHPIHLLGVALPQEGVYYRNNEWVKSVDTSNPVIHGMFGTRYETGGVDHKRSELLADFIHNQVAVKEEAKIWHNIDEFRKLWMR